jgi:hypothetical protein
MNGGEASFDVRTLGTGLYLLKVNQNGRVYTVKLAIVKQ